ncbi:MAG: hypothetical protein A2Y10_00030 [Planctomycetes bacterium GWF2_41_51]|nr:MAG: hypothetical protein A2Y10_00030 [Planctomycetes bacterium GWF2_41_51]HBG28627.1 hypothetical protein [Phycisphaerales bacterium]
MFLKKKINECIILSILLAQVSWGATFIINHWIHTVQNNLWQNPDNWSQGRVPVYYNDGETKYDIVYINSTPSSSQGCVIEDGNNIAYSIYISRNGESNEPAVLTMNGGYLEVKGWEMKLGYDDANASRGIFNLNDGTVNISGTGGVCIGYGLESQAEININAGIFRTQKLYVSFTGSNAYGRLNLNGGMFFVGLGNYFFVNQPGRIDIYQGMLVINGNVESYVQNLVQANLITAYNGTGTINVTYNEAANQTVVSASPDIIIDFSIEKGSAINRAAGFLHSISPNAPDANLVNVLKPKIFRLSATRGYGDTGNAFENYQRVHNVIGADIQIVLSDGFRDTVGGWPGDNSNWIAWEDYVRGIVNDAKDGNYIFQWDIWNEANTETFWNPDGTATEKRERFFEAWKRAWLIIKSINPEAEIVGPSNSWYQELSNRWFTVEEFLSFAKGNDVLPDILTWHTWNENTIIPDTTQARNFMAANGFNIDRIVINEYGGIAQHVLPGTCVWYFANVQDANVYGVRACTLDPEGCSTCWNVSLTGLLTYPEQQPRSTWWTYKSYAEITGTLVEVMGNDNINGLAAKDADAYSVLSRPQVKILLGKRAGVTEDEFVLLTGLENSSYLKDDSGYIRLKVEHIPNSGWDALPAPVSVSDTLIRFANSINVLVPDFGPADAYIITITNPKIYKVDMNNLSIFISHWLDDNSDQQGCNDYPVGDLDYNCKVNFVDLSLLSLYWF